MTPDERRTVVDEDRWSPGGPPPAPGWYEDPWNASNLRRWDGTQWTGETGSKTAGPPPEAEPQLGPAPRDEPDATWAPAATEPAPPAAAPAPPTPAAPASAPAATTRRLLNPFVIAGAVAAIAVVGVVVALSGHSSSPSGGTAATLSPPPASTAPLGLPASVLTGADLGPGWTATPSAHAMTAAEYTAGPCGSTLWARNVGGYESAFVKGASAATAHGAAVSNVFEAPSIAVANQQWAVISAPAYASCLEQRIIGEVRSQLPAGAGQSVTGATMTPFSLDLSVPSRAFVVSVTVTAPGGATHQVTDNAVAISSGRYIATVDVSWSSDAPLGSQIVQEQAANEATHLSALS